MKRKLTRHQIQQDRWIAEAFAQANKRRIASNEFGCEQLVELVALILGCNIFVSSLTLLHTNIGQISANQMSDITLKILKQKLTLAGGNCHNLAVDNIENRKYYC
jgi:hypothetical protein